MSEEQKKGIQQVLRMLSALSVSGDAVDVMAGAKAILREILAEEEKQDG